MGKTVMARCLRCSVCQEPANFIVNYSEKLCLEHFGRRYWPGTTGYQYPYSWVTVTF
jgi:hypothetical protein